LLKRQGTVKIEDVARAAGVSRATAAAALSDTGRRPGEGPRAKATRKRIQDLAEKLGYERNALGVALSSGRTFTVGLICHVHVSPGKTVDINGYQKDVILAVACACARADLRMSTILLTNAQTVKPCDVTDGRVDGVVLAAVLDDDLTRAIFSRGFPAVSIGSGYTERHVAIDNAGGIARAVVHLAELGHRRIGYASYADYIAETPQERLTGYIDAMQACGFEPQFFDANDIDGFLSCTPSRRPTALVCFNDDIALEAVRRAHSLGLRVPADLSVVGFDNIELTRESAPRLTTVHNPLEEQADVAVSLLQALWRGDDATPPPPVPTNLIVRDSTAPPFFHP